MANKEINPQPLLESQGLYDHGTPQYWQKNLREKLDPFNPFKLGINYNNFINAYLIANYYGYSFDNIVNYLMAQTQINTHELSFTLDTHHTTHDRRDIQELKQELLKFGKNLEITETAYGYLQDVEQVAGICTTQELLDAITYQFVHNKDHSIHLYIGQDETTQSDWLNIHQNYVVGNTPKLKVQDANDFFNFNNKDNHDE